MPVICNGLAKLRIKLIDDASFIHGVLFTPLQTCNVDAGNVLQAMGTSSKGFVGFGEAYFSTIKFGAVKAWKRHHRMTLNLVVPYGNVRFVIHDARPDSPSFNTFQEIVISPASYARLTVPPMLWMGFQGISRDDSIVLNLANIEHDIEEADRVSEDEFSFDWGKK